MIKRFGALILLFMLLFSTSQVNAGTPIRFGVYENSPLIFMDESGHARGLVIDILETIAEAEAWDIQYVPCEWAQCLNWLEIGRLDLLGPIAFSEERSILFDFTDESVISNWGQIYQHPGENIESFLDLNGKRLAVLREDIYTSEILKILEAFDVSVSRVTADDYNTVLALVEADEADAGLVNRLYASQYAADYEIQQTPIIFHPIEVRYGALKGANTELLTTIDTHLLALKADQGSAYFRSLNTWFGNTETWQMPDWVPWVLGITFAVLVFFLASNYLLRVSVRARTLNLETEISAHKLTETVLQEKTRQQESMMETAHSLMESLDINDVLERISRHAKNLLNAYGVSTYLLEGNGEILTPVVAIEPGIEELILATPLNVRDSYTGLAVIKKSGVIINDPKPDGIGTLIPGTDDDPDERVLVVPFILEGNVYGAMCLSRSGKQFKQEDLEIAETLAVFASTTLKKARDHTRLLEEVTKRELAEERIQEYADHLEKMVVERTYDLEQAQKQLIRHERLAVMDDLAEGIGHELRNPLGVINNAAYYLNMVLPVSDEKVKECMELIQTNIQKATQIVNKLLSFTRIKSVERIPVQVSILVPTVVAQNPVPENVTVNVENCTDLPSVYIGYSQIEQVLGNLLLNAYQAMPDGGQVTVYCKLSEDSETPMVAVSVQDTGTGISPANQNKIFEPLFTTKQKGIGLGLAIAKRLVEANEGHIDFYSEGIAGKGSKFTILLPLESGIGL